MYRGTCCYLRKRGVPRGWGWKVANIES